MCTFSEKGGVFIKKGDVVYYARIIPTVGLYDVCEIKVRYVTDTWFSGVEKTTKTAFLFSNKEIDKNVFMKRNDALKIVLDKEKNAPKRIYSTYTEEW